MKPLIPLLLSLLTAGSPCGCVKDSPLPSSSPSPDRTVTERPSQINRFENNCQGNGVNNRQEWCGFDINTDYTTITPDTGVTREFWLELDQLYLAPDGRARWTLAINGTIPGPTLEVNWGDTVVVHLLNKLPSTVRNGTSMHFHGIRQHYTNPSDGVVSITQCPIRPGERMTYRWRATQYGTTWYHSHIGLQTWEGAFGGIIIHGPASANYDDDKGTIFLNDWDTRTVDELWEYAQKSGPPTVDNGLINGMNVFGEDGDPAQSGKRFTMSFIPGRSYRLRIGNAACDTHFKFSIDHHTLTVIAADLVPIRPYKTTVLDIAVGQRYDIIVHANQNPTDLSSTFWLRAIPQTSCSKNSNAANIRGIITYATSDSCTDEDATHITPIITADLTLPEKITYNKSLPVGITLDSNQHYRWTLNGTSMQLDWANPTLQSLSTQAPDHDSTNTNTSSNAVIDLPDPDAWAIIIIETTLAAPHPVHLHGHDFLIVAQGQGPYRYRYRPPADVDFRSTPARARARDQELGLDAASTKTQTQAETQAQTQSPNVRAGDGEAITFLSGSLPKRDTALLPASGHLVIAFKTDNPGAWLLHCHIGWHLEQGFGVQFVEREDEVRRLFGGEWRELGKSMGERCSRWKGYWGEYGDENGSGV
ncbi:hypothetical protein N7533_000934 [Penicillium manginii]|uniref:uncharacterized protein n=1 Tax=Penicillium manginii TaxID=203109 RepID=UPI00254910A4|nr:uncharacterized protein N7533_000934 [Penicillium manginii]KAJ5768351.1 hypothetical protein N7533_000934 [Penicillium manginii]